MAYHELATPMSAIPDEESIVGDRLSLGVAARLSRYLQVLTQATQDGQGDDLLARALRLHPR